LPTQSASPSADAAGQAHDRNNLLQVAFCLVEALHLHLPNDSIALRKLEELNRVLKDLAHMNESVLRRFRDQGHGPCTASATPEGGALVEADEVIARAVALAQTLAPKHVRIELLLGAIGATLPSSEIHLQQVVFNLLKNALEAVPEGGSVVVESAIESDGGGDLSRGRRQALRITITDDGPGIPKELRSRLFECGYTSKPEGHGLGLHHTRRILSLYGGSVTLDDSRACGTRATLLWPFGKTDPA
jgi:signal transduction histidine kinase